jgi:hypothetical protein
MFVECYTRQKCLRHSVKNAIPVVWVIGFGLLLSKLILVYAMGGDFVSYLYLWVQFCLIPVF